MRPKPRDPLDNAVDAAIAARTGKLPMSLLSMMPPHVAQASLNVAMILAVHRVEGFYCGLCGKGPFTMRGFRLHALRRHYREIYDLIADEASRISSSSRFS